MTTADFYFPVHVLPNTDSAKLNTVCSIYKKATEEDGLAKFQSVTFTSSPPPPKKKKIVQKLLEVIFISVGCL